MVSSEEPLPSFCLNLPSQKSSTSSSEDSESDSGDSRISFTIRLDGVGSPSNNGLIRTPSEAQLGNNNPQELDDTQQSPATILNVKEQQLINETENKSSLQNLSESQESQDTPLKLNQRKRKKFAIID